MALWPHGRAAGGPREAQEVHKARTRGSRPRVSKQSTRTPVRTPRGEMGLRLEGPQVSGLWLGIRGGNALALNRPPI